MLFFSNKCCFSFKSRFYLNECTESSKTNICFRKTTFLLKMRNNYAILLPESNITSFVLVDSSNQHPSMILRFSKNLDFWQILKIDFEHHICCHEHALSNIINWHIGEEASVATNRQQMFPPPCLISHVSFLKLIVFKYW